MKQTVWSHMISLSGDTQYSLSIDSKRTEKASNVKFIIRMQVCKTHFHVYFSSMCSFHIISWKKITMESISSSQHITQSKMNQKYIKNTTVTSLA